MKIGDNVELKDKFMIVEYDPKDRLFSIKLSDNSTQYIVAQIPLLNVVFPINDFVFPGDHLPVDHPDYYKRVSVDRNSGATYERNGIKYTIELFTDFRYSGKYRLVPKSNSKITVERRAMLRSPTARGEDYAGLLGEWFTGSAITGKILRIFPLSFEEIEYYTDSNDIKADEDEIIIVFSDENAEAEYYFSKSQLRITWLNMIIIQEKPSYTGDPRTKILQRATKFRRVKLYMNATKKSEHIIWITNYEGDYPMIFPGEKLRDKAFDTISRANNADTVVLDLHEYFFEEFLADNIAQTKINYSINRHIKSCLNYLLKRDDLFEIHKRLAFNHFSYQDLINITRDEHVDIVPKPDIWSKTLYTPKDILDAGITPRQFFRLLTWNNS